MTRARKTGANAALNARKPNHRCSRCGGTVDPDRGRARPIDSGLSTWDVECDVCKVDLVQRWGDLVRASAAEGNDVRLQLVPYGEQFGLARVLETAGLVGYVTGVCAWVLTGTGQELLERWDASKAGTP